MTQDSVDVSQAHLPILPIPALDILVELLAEAAKLFDLGDARRQSAGAAVGKLADCEGGFTGFTGGILLRLGEGRCGNICGKGGQSVHDG